MRKDPLGYYATLRVSQDADLEEIELAYSMLKGTDHEHGVRGATGHVIGEIRYGELEVERGGKMSGNIQNVVETEASSSDVKASQGDSA